VKHCSLVDESPVERHFGVQSGYVQGFIGYCKTVFNKYPEGVASFGTIFFYDIYRYHFLLNSVQR